MIQRALAAVAAVAWLSACAPRVDIEYHSPRDLEALHVTKVPRLYLPEVEDRTAGFVTGAAGFSAPGRLTRPLADTLHDALAADLRKLRVPVLPSQSGADAVLKAAITAEAVQGPSGENPSIEGVVSADFQLRNAAGDLLWSTQATGTSDGFPEDGANAVMNRAFDQLMRKFEGAVHEQDAFGKVFGAQAAYAMAREAAPREEPVKLPAPASDVDEPPPPAARRSAHAIVIGIEHYPESQPAVFAAHDAGVVARYYERVLGVPEENVALLTDEHATRGELVKYLERWLPSRVQPGEDVYVYYAGYGAPDLKTGDSYLVPYDGDPGAIDETGFALARLYDDLSKLQAARVVVVLDSSFSGAGGRSIVAAGTRPLLSVRRQAVPDNVTVLAASADDEVSNADLDKAHGLFTYYFLRGLKAYGSDLHSVFDYLKPEVQRVARSDDNADQEPQWRGAK